MVLAQFLELWNNDKSPRMLVHTSGSTGKPKPLWVENTEWRLVQGLLANTWD